jgi:hypothetical protein
MTIPVGYCTNVHAGATLEETRANLERYAVGVKQRFSPDAAMGVGLWLSASAARKLFAEKRVADFRDWLAGAGLVPYTFNGFPYGDFHQAVVKHDVYRPTWTEQSRVDYTRDLIAIQHALLPPGMAGSISTLPLAWGDPRPDAAHLDAATANLRKLADELAQLERETGRFICLCLEPEPGCVLQVSDDLVCFFEKHLLRGEDEAAVRRHIRVCHDVCHAAVMFEEQADVLRRYHAAGIAVGKVQVSSAVRAPLDELPDAERPAALAQLAEFDERRYLHQTMVREAGGPPTFYEDLSEALAEKREALSGEWRVHFHVPIYVRRFGRLEAMQGAILDCVRTLRELGPEPPYEVETYAWTVLPPELQQPDLAAGITEELAWFRGVSSASAPDTEGVH